MNHTLLRLPHICLVIVQIDASALPPCLFAQSPSVCVIKISCLKCHGNKSFCKFAPTAAIQGHMTSILGVVAKDHVTIKLKT